MRKDLTFDERELAEIHHSLHYMKNLHHGTVGHNLLMLVGKMADAIGFEVDPVEGLTFRADPTPRDLFFTDSGYLKVKTDESS